VVRVVGFDKVFDDRTAFPEDYVGVGVFNGGHATVWVEADKWLFLHFVKSNWLDLIRDAELAEDDEHLQGISG